MGPQQSNGQNANIHIELPELNYKNDENEWVPNQKYENNRFNNFICDDYVDSNGTIIDPTKCSIRLPLVNSIESQHYTTNGSNIGNTDTYRDGMVCDGVCLDEDNENPCESILFGTDIIDNEMSKDSCHFSQIGMGEIGEEPIRGSCYVQNYTCETENNIRYLLDDMIKIIQKILLLDPQKKQMMAVAI